MAASSNVKTLSLEFGSLHTALHETRIGDQDLADGQNWLSRDGTVRLDQRYIKNCEVANADYLTTGSGYGRWEPEGETTYDEFQEAEDCAAVALLRQNGSLYVGGDNTDNPFGLGVVGGADVTTLTLSATNVQIAAFASDGRTDSTPDANTGLYVGTDGYLYVSGDPVKGLYGNGAASLPAGASGTTWFQTTYNFGSDVAQLHANYYSARLIDSDGALWFWGRRDVSTYPDGSGNAAAAFLIPTKVVNSGVEWVHGTSQATLYINGEGDLFVTGSNVGTGSVVTTFTQSTSQPEPFVKAYFDNTYVGYNCIIALGRSGTVWVSGLNNMDAYGGTLFAQARATGYSNYLTWESVVGLATNITDIRVSEGLHCALDEGGNVWTWGLANDKNMGRGEDDGARIPPGIILGECTKINVFLNGGFALREVDDVLTVYKWGKGANYPFGDTTNTTVSTPTPITVWTIAKTVTGTTQWEQYVAVIDQKLRLIDLSAGEVCPFIDVLNGEQSGTGEWFFQQFAQHIYGVNETTGLWRKLIGEGDDGTGDWTNLQLPIAPTDAPTAEIYVPKSFLPVQGGSIPNLPPDDTASASDATRSVYVEPDTIGANSGIRDMSFSNGTILIHHRDEVPHQEYVHLNLVTTRNGGSSQNIWDLSYRDFMRIAWTRKNGGSRMYHADPVLFLLDTGGSRVAAQPWFDPVPVDGTKQQYWRLHNMSRTSRDEIKELQFYFEFKGTNLNANYEIAGFESYGVWLSIPSSKTVGNGENPPFKPLYYEYTYYNEDSGLESAPSPAAVIAADKQDRLGNWVDITAPVSTEAIVTHVRFYRVVVDDEGIKTRYRLPNIQGETDIPNAGTPTVRDRYSLDEVELFDIYHPSVLPPDGLRSICAWLNRLVILDKHICYISQDGEPIQFEPLEGAYDPLNPARGFTFRPDDNQAEYMLGVCSNENLYVITDASVRCLFGSDPDNWRLFKMPGSEGACGRRAFTPYLNGVLVLTPTGRLHYYQPGSDKPQDVGAALNKRFGNQGIAGYANSDAIVAVRPDGQIEIRSEGRYLLLDVNGMWRQGTHTHPTQSVLYVPYQPIRWMGKNGKLYEGGDDDFITDGGDTGNNGTSVEWYVTTKKFRLPRMRAKNVNWGDSIESTNATVHFPTFEVLGTRDEKVYKKRQGKDNMRVGPMATDTTLQFKIRGDCYTVVEECRIDLIPMSGARQT